MAKRYFGGFQMIHCQSLGSTNEETHRRIRQGTARHGDVIIAEYQEKGKGQDGNRWFSSPGRNILISVLSLNKPFPVKNLNSMNMLISLAIHQTISHFFPGKVEIKWPNDLMIGGKKAAGVLIETSVSGETVNHCITGIGININEERFPEGLPHACSFKTLTGIEYDRNDILLHLLDQLNRTFSENDPPVFELIREKYEQVMYGYRKECRFSSSEGGLTGTIIGINPIGQLRLSTTEGERCFNQKEIQFELL